MNFIQLKILKTQKVSFRICFILKKKAGTTFHTQLQSTQLVSNRIGPQFCDHSSIGFLSDKNRGSID